MTSAPTTTTSQPAADDRRQVRLQLKPMGTVTGRVDGGWWPRSRDLPAETPALLAVLTDPMGPVESVSYNLDDWGPTARRISLDGRVVRLAGYRSQPAGTVDVISPRHRVTLLVVPPDAAPQDADAALAAAGRPGNTDEVEALLRTPPAGPAPRP